MGTVIERIGGKSVRLFQAIFAFTLIGLIAVPFCRAGNPANKGPQIEYIAPDGQFLSLNASHPSVRQTTTAFVDNNTISCVLREGETTFIIQLPKNSPPDRFTFLNENAAACGELRIAVSNSALPADSPKWTEVDGIVPFAHKRLFKLSMLGVDTKFVRLSFKVDGQRPKSVRISDPFGNSVLAAAINSNFGRLHERGVDLSIAATSVAALPAKQK